MLNTCILILADFIFLKLFYSPVDKYTFFFYAMPPEGTMSLKDMHDLIRDVWLARHDQELQTEQAARRKGRPKSMREMKLEEINLQESEEYRTGIGNFLPLFGWNLPRLMKIVFDPVVEVIDLTHEANVELFRRWDGSEAAYVQQLRHIRISGMHPDSKQISKHGHHPTLCNVLSLAADEDTNYGMDIVENPATSNTQPIPHVPIFEQEEPSKFASTIMTMGGPI
jgi:translation machinery-associated protein 16